ncbi:MAG: 50S ribosomal protein L11 methyltransferase [Bosea sp. (in: a-proteobacteria)]
MREGLIPHAVSTVLTLATTEAKARVLTELIGEMLDPTETAVSAFEVEDGTLKPAWKVEVYFASEPDREEIGALLTPILGASVPDSAYTEVNQKDWVSASLSGLKPVRAGRILVHGSHDRHHLRANDLGLEIEAALAFGTGHHGTTAGCLLALVDELKRRRPRHALDVGTGTGILAFAYAKQVKRMVVAGDIDDEAIRVARANAGLNGIGPLMRLYVGPGIRHEEAKRIGHFDLVMANILARPLMRLARDISSVMALGGTLILSGLLASDVNQVAFAYRQMGLSLARKTLREGWATLVLKHNGASFRPRR